MSITSNPKSISCDTQDAMLAGRLLLNTVLKRSLMQAVRFSLKDKRLKMRVSAEYSPADFVALLAEQYQIDIDTRSAISGFWRRAQSAKRPKLSSCCYVSRSDLVHDD